MQRWLGVVSALLLLAAICATVSAQETTPTSGFTVADPDLCRIQPRSIADLTSFVATPAPGYTAPEPIDPPVGEPADRDTVAAVTATTMELYACLNANDYMRAFALFTDELLTREFPEGDLTEASIEAYNTSSPPQPEESWWSIRLEGITVLDDGRVGAIVVEHNPQARGEDNRIYMLFTHQEGRYLVDGVLPLGE